MISLTGTGALVTGASHGIGKGIAAALGDGGATVYVTGRTAAVGEHELPGTIGETAAEVTRRGGTGIAVQMDHADDGQVTAPFDRIRVEQGRLDIRSTTLSRCPITSLTRNRSGRNPYPTGRWLTSALPTPFADVPDIEANGISARDRTDPSYQRPLVNRRDPNNPPPPA